MDLPSQLSVLGPSPTQAQQSPGFRLYKKIEASSRAEANPNPDPSNITSFFSCIELTNLTCYFLECVVSYL